MPLYEYLCECKKVTEKFELMSGSHLKTKCKCGLTATRIFTPLALVTDTSFCMTGVKDSRLDNEVIEGRTHWKRKLDEKGYMELSQSHVNNL